MLTNQIFKTILFPTDFSESSLKSLQYAVDLSIACKAELIILYAYRLIGNNDQENILESKRKIESIARESFEKIDEGYLKKSGVKYTYLSEVGFISDRIISNVQFYGADLVVLCEGMQKQIRERSEKGYQGIMNKISCPIMLVPESIPDYNHLIP